MVYTRRLLAFIPASVRSQPLFFGSVSPVIQADSDAFTMRLINGDLHVLEPRAGVKLIPGRTYRITASYGGGGRGMRTVADRSTLDESVTAARREASPADVCALPGSSRSASKSSPSRVLPRLVGTIASLTHSAATRESLRQSSS